MPNANRDASLTTARRRHVTLFAWKANGNTGVKAEQSATNGNENVGNTAAVPLASKLGAILAGQSGQCACSAAISLQGYDKHPSVCSDC